MGEKALWEQGTGWTQSKRIGSDGLEGYHSLGMWIEKKNKVEQTLDDLYDQSISECNINDAKNSG